MIDTITPEQLKKIPNYVDNWVKRGLTTKKMELDSAIKDFTEFQTKILNRENPTPVVLLDSPSQCWRAILMAFSGDYRPDDPVWNKVQTQLDGQSAKLVQPSEKVKFEDVEKTPFVYPYYDCQFWAGWFAFYDFMKFEMGVTYSNDDLYEVFKRCQPYGLVWPTEYLCVVCQPPTVLTKNSSALHCETGPAISYSGENEIYALNGVVMDKKYVLTPAEKMNPIDVLSETNVEIRRELLRKVGIERMLSELPNKLLDKRDNYELYSVTLSPEIPDARYLKMTNPSIGCFHMEGVDPSVSTVKQALEWRNQNFFTDAEILT